MAQKRRERHKVLDLGVPATTSIDPSARTVTFSGLDLQRNRNVR